jgi:hypothetical protein
MVIFTTNIAYIYIEREREREIEELEFIDGRC